MNPHDLLRELVRIPSVSGEEQAAADFLGGRLAALGMEVRHVGPNVIAEFAAADAAADAPVLLYCSHLDTVPAGQGWTADPWAVDWQDGRLVGLGANDAKASVAAMCAATAAAVAAPELLGGLRLRLGLVACEETDNSGMQTLIDAVGLPHAAVIGEPTGLEVVRSQAGLAVLLARWRGSGCHAAHAGRVEHDNALLTAAAELAALPVCISMDAGHPLLGPTTLVPTILHAGDRHNRIPDLAEAVFDARVTPPHRTADLLAELQARLPNAELAVRSDRLAAKDTAADHPFVAAAVGAAGAVAAIGSNTMSDMALLGEVPAVKCGPGRTERSHTANEFVTADELQAGVDFYKALLPRAAAALSTTVVR